MAEPSTRALPANVKLHPSLRLATWKPQGVLDLSLAREIHAFLQATEASDPEPFHRFTDLSGLTEIHLSFKEVEELADGRIDSYQGPKVKSAILAGNPLAFGIARMYEQLMRRSPIEVGVYCGLTTAADWLQMPAEVLATA